MDGPGDDLLIALAIVLAIFWIVGTFVWGFGSLIWVVLILALGVGGVALVVSGDADR